MPDPETTATASSSSSLDKIIEEALNKYEEETKKDLRSLMVKMKREREARRQKENEMKKEGNEPEQEGNEPEQEGNEPEQEGNEPKQEGNEPKQEGNELKPEGTSDDITLADFRDQVQEFKKFAARDDKLMKSLKPIVHVLYAFSSTTGAGVTLVFKPANVIFAGFSVLLSAANDVIASHNALTVIFERIGKFFRRLEKNTEEPTMEAIKDIIVDTMVEVLKIFAFMTKEVKRGRTMRLLKDFARNLIGNNVIKDALNELDRLTQEGVKRVIEHTSNTADRIESKLNRVIKAEEERKAREDEEKRRQKIEDSRRRVQEHRQWLSPPNSSDDQNKHIASQVQREHSATWIFGENIFMEWNLWGSNSTKSLLWIHGKPGSGKSVLCSAIIEDITKSQRVGLVTMAYFYFVFDDANKQSLQNALFSLLTQLSASSDGYCDILSRVYEEHNNGTYRPNLKKMSECLKEMLTLPNQRPVYIILDALDECPKTSGVPPFRKQVLDLLKDLVDLRLSHLHICVTSRRESDIEAALERLPFHSISIHDQFGQKKEIEAYIKSVVYAESGTEMQEWIDQDKKLVIETLSKRADGMFRWVFCQLEVLQHCDPESISQTLDELPNSLYGTYESVLKEIGKASPRLQNLAFRLLQCLAVAIRPLRVEELAEILAIDFDGTEGATPQETEGSRLESQLRNVRSKCSSLIALVGDGDSRVIQFSHLSVKEFLTSGRLLATSHGDNISQFYIEAKLAHMTLAQACLGTLLHLGYRPNLRLYASQHWVDHAQFETVSSGIENGMRDLFDEAQPYFAAWLQLHDIDDRWTDLGNFADPHRPHRGSPLYYASLCGFRNLAERIIDENPEQVNARGGHNHSPLTAALYKRHFAVADLLSRHGAAVDVTGYNNQTLLQAVLVDRRSRVAQWLLGHGADPNSQQDGHLTPLYLATANGNLAVVRTLLRYDVRVNAADADGRTPLHLASSSDDTEIVRLLLGHRANPNAEDKDGRTPLYLTWTTLVARLLLDNGASADVKNKEGRTVLQVALRMGKYEIVQMMKEHGAHVDRELLDSSRGEAAVTG